MDLILHFLLPRISIEILPSLRAQPEAKQSCLTEIDPNTGNILILGCQQSRSKYLKCDVSALSAYATRMTLGWREGYLDKDQLIANALVNKIERQQDIEVQKIVSF